MPISYFSWACWLVFILILMERRDPKVRIGSKFKGIDRNALLCKAKGYKKCKDTKF